MVKKPALDIARYLIFGDLHGRILTAFRLALRWVREHGIRLNGLLQVGDLGYFPETAQLEKAPARPSPGRHSHSSGIMGAGMVRSLRFPEIPRYIRRPASRCGRVVRAPRRAPSGG
jgi:hypothetical protein